MTDDDGFQRDDNKNINIHCPYGRPGDELWVRETWKKGIAHYQKSEVPCCRFRENPDIPKTADIKVKNACWENHWRPSIFMPRWASRIQLRITNVQIERLQDISEEDAKAEGAFETNNNLKQQAARTGIAEKKSSIGAIDYFRQLWDSLNAKRGYGWESNPWVWVVGFAKIKPE